MIHFWVCISQIKYKINTSYWCDQSTQLMRYIRPGCIGMIKTYMAACLSFNIWYFVISLWYWVSSVSRSLRDGTGALGSFLNITQAAPRVTGDNLLLPNTRLHSGDIYDLLRRLIVRSREVAVAMPRYRCHWNCSELRCFSVVITPLKFEDG